MQAYVVIVSVPLISVFVPHKSTVRFDVFLLNLVLLPCQ